MRLRVLFLLGLSCAVAVACSMGTPSIPDDETMDAGTSSPLPGPTPEADGGQDAGPPQSVTFSYRPSWKGAKTVEVLGAFGQGTDWKDPLVTLTDDGTGAFSGNATLPAGHYAYVFHVVGDQAAAMPDTYARFAIDPTRSAFVACPSGAPTFSNNVANPCSDLTVPAPAADATFHARGSVVSSGSPAADYLVEIERDETDSHHMFVDRTTTHADGTFDLAVAPGTYRLQVLHPSYYTKTDAQRTQPENLAAVRRSVSSAMKMDADRMVNAAEIAYADYAAMTPHGSATLPTAFTFTVPAGTKARAAVYGPGKEVGDPWWTAPFGAATTDEFDGGFNTDKASDGGLQADASYFWGTERQYRTPDGGVTWTAQSMVFPVQWPGAK